MYINQSYIIRHSPLAVILTVLTSTLISIDNGLLRDSSAVTSPSSSLTV